MIVFDLRCAKEHVFEAWFASSTAFETQNGQGLVACPVCGDVDVNKAVMAPAVPAKTNAAPSAQAVKAALATLALTQAEALKNSTWVGATFAERARKMHDGTEPIMTIHGQATPSETRQLVEDGVPISPLPLPVIPPEHQN